jgi:hypothetical protein
MIGGRVIDSGVLVDAAAGKTIYSRALIRTAVEHSIVLAVPATALMTAWAAIPVRERPLLDLVLDIPVAVIDPLDPPAARDAGVLVADAPDGAATNLCAGHVALSARRRKWPVVTTEPRPLRAIDPTLELETLPQSE